MWGLLPSHLDPMKRNITLIYSVPQEYAFPSTDGTKGFIFIFFRQYGKTHGSELTHLACCVPKH